MSVLCSERALGVRRWRRGREDGMGWNTHANHYAEPLAALCRLVAEQGTGPEDGVFEFVANGVSLYSFMH